MVHSLWSHRAISPHRLVVVRLAHSFALHKIGLLIVIGNFVLEIRLFPLPSVLQGVHHHPQWEWI